MGGIAERLIPLVASARRSGGRTWLPHVEWHSVGVAILVDPPQVPGHGRLWSHVASDRSYDELHAFARSIGIPERGFDGDHYDIPAEAYDSVVAAGAEPVSSRELVARLRSAGLRRRRPRRQGG